MHRQKSLSTNFKRRKSSSSLANKLEAILHEKFPSGFCRVLQASLPGKVRIVIVDDQFNHMDTFVKIQGVVRTLDRAVKKGLLTEFEMQQIASINALGSLELA